MKKKKFEQLPFILFALCCIAVKLILMRDVKLQVIANAQADDELMVHLAEQLLQGHWLGNYNQFTLVKECFFPFFLAVGNWMHIDYISMVQICYGLACYAFVRSVRPLTRKNIIQYVLFLLLFFHPIMATNDVIQRVYRNSLTPIQVLLVIGGYIGAYTYRNNGLKAQIKWLAVAGLGLTSMWMSREDGVWIIPFALITSIFMICRSWKEKKVKILFAVMIPFVCLFVSVQVVSLINKIQYKVYADTEINKSAFPDVMKSLYEIDMGDENIPYVSISRDKIEKVYEISPSMAQIQDVLDPLLDAWSQNAGKEDSNKEEKEVENGWFFWVLRDAVAAKGYYANGAMANEFYNRVANEIQTAFEEGKLEWQLTMPSALMPPLREETLLQLLPKMAQAADFVASCDKLGLRNIQAVDDGADGIARFEVLTGRSAEYEEKEFDESRYEPENRIMNRITDIWQMCSGTVAWIWRACYLILVLLWLFRKLDRQEQTLLLILTGILGALACLYAGVSYNELNSCTSITELYLCGGYPISFAFDFIAICTFGQYGVALIKEHFKQNSPIAP